MQYRQKQYTNNTLLNYFLQSDIINYYDADSVYFAGLHGFRRSLLFTLKLISYYREIILQVGQQFDNLQKPNGINKNAISNLKYVRASHNDYTKKFGIGLNFINSTRRSRKNF